MDSNVKDSNIAYTFGGLLWNEHANITLHVWSDRPTIIIISVVKLSAIIHIFKKGWPAALPTNSTAFFPIDHWTWPGDGNFGECFAIPTACNRASSALNRGWPITRWLGSEMSPSLQLINFNYSKPLSCSWLGVGFLGALRTFEDLEEKYH